MDYEIIIINSDDNIETVEPRIRFTKEQIKKAIENAIVKIRNKSPDVCYNGDPGF